MIWYSLDDIDEGIGQATNKKFLNKIIKQAKRNN